MDLVPLSWNDGERYSVSECGVIISVCPAGRGEPGYGAVIVTGLL